MDGYQIAVGVVAKNLQAMGVPPILLGMENGTGYHSGSIKPQGNLNA